MKLLLCIVLFVLIGCVGCEPNSVKQYIILATECCDGVESSCAELEARGWQLPECRE